jgi:hypothetical protein
MTINVGLSFTDFTIVGANLSSPYTISNAINSIGSILGGAYLNNNYANFVNSGFVNQSNISPAIRDISSSGGASRETVNL